jgi:hypothetical protein
MWNAEQAFAKTHGRPTDLSSEEIAERLAECQGCKHRMGGQCKPARAVITVHALRQQNRCPKGKWPGSVTRVEVQPKSSPAFVYPEAEPRPINRLAAVTCHFNPCGYSLIESNYHRFAKALPQELDLWTIELAYGDATFRLPDGPRMLRVRGDSRHVLWQKERLLNLAIDALPSDVDAVAWLDADLIWLNRDWPAEACRLLERYNAVQLFEHVVDSDREGHLGQRSPGHVYAKLNGMGYGRPGGAWAARREAIACGLYDRHVIGGGDSATLSAWEGREKLPQSLQHGTAWETYYQDWAVHGYEQVRGSLACVPGDVVHLYHGTRENRQYVERYQIFHDHAYDPVRDVAIDPDTGLLQWSRVAQERKPDLVRRVAEYFEERREDE